MFCIYCGKQTENQNAVCDECTRARQVPEDVVNVGPESAEAQPVEKAEKKNPDKMFGFGKALSAVICGVLGWILSWAVISYGSAIIDCNFQTGVVSYALLMVAAVGLGVYSLTMGVKSIAIHGKGPKGGNPVVAFALGIGSVCVAALTLMFVFLSLVAVVSII